MSTINYYEITRTIRKIINLIESNTLYRRILVYSLLTILAIVAVYIRALPALKWGLELHGNDPWIAYWETKYVYEHGPLSWWSLTRDNPATQIFWYPWGRDFVSTDYPGIALWTAITYPIAGAFGLSLKEWLALQPLVFAALSTLTIFLAVRELMGGSNIAGLVGALLYAIIPAASDRTIVGFVEKEGIALAFVFLFIYFYAKVMKTRDPRKRLYNTIFAALSLSAVGWFWGGFIYILVSIPLALVLYPIFAGKNFNIEVIKYSILLVILGIVFTSPIRTSMKILGFYPFKVGVGALALASFALPLLYYFLAIKKKIIGRGIYFIIVVALAVTGLALIALGVIPIGARYAYALGLKPFLKLGPLVESIEEHQPAINPSRPATFIRVLYTWGWTGFFLAIIGALYMLYKGRPETVYVGLAFLIAFYAYINVTYFEATASSLGIVTASTFLTAIVERIIPSKRQQVEGGKRKSRKKRQRTSVTIYKRGKGNLYLTIILLLMLFLPMVHATTVLIETHENMIPSIMAAGTSIANRNDAWYELVDFIKQNLSKNALIVTWWDYGYWISVLTGRRTLADGATLNGTQISLLAKILTAFNETEALKILKELKAPINDTYILTFDVFYFVKQNNTVYVLPYISQNPREFYPTIDTAGLVDIRKSIWMIKIGRRDPADYLFLFNNNNAVPRIFGINLARYYISPKFGTPWDLPIIYKMMVNGILYLDKQDPGKEYHFLWLNGTQTIVPAEIQKYIEQLGVKYSIDVVSIADMYGEKYYSKSSMIHIKPYKIIAEPFYNNKYLYVVIFLFKVEFSP